jgi:hypothetical protein
MTGCTALRLPSQGDPGVVHSLPLSDRVVPHYCALPMCPEHVSPVVMDNGDLS